jgi:SAM-dependent methyltransferase
MVISTTIMQQRHKDRFQYFQEQAAVTERFVMPYIQSVMTLSNETVVAEIGCAEAGNLRPFLDLGCKTIGLDLSEGKIKNAEKFYASHPHKQNLTLIVADILSVPEHVISRPDLIIMRDTIEHIENHELLLTRLRGLLKPGGKIFLAFPPWTMPFGGHQQTCKSKVLSKLPYIHLLPLKFYRWLLTVFGENQNGIQELIELRNTKLSIKYFKRILTKSNLRIDREEFYLINPNYEIKFRLKARTLPKFLNLAVLREFFTTTCYYVVSQE